MERSTKQRENKEKETKENKKKETKWQWEQVNELEIWKIIRKMKKESSSERHYTNEGGIHERKEIVMTMKKCLETIWNREEIPEE